MGGKCPILREGTNSKMKMIITLYEVLGKISLLLNVIRERQCTPFSDNDNLGNKLVLNPANKKYVINKDTAF